GPQGGRGSRAEGGGPQGAFARATRAQRAAPVRHSRVGHDCDAASYWQCAIGLRL
ncbi:MAG: hypothetical protein RLZZ143_3262, partial [Cyanobacteriota bacterium]